MDIGKLAKQFSKKGTGDLTTNDKVHLKQELSDCKPGELKSLRDHEMFLNLLHLLRQATLEDMKLSGKNFLPMLRSLLSVGEDGVYSNKLRFLYELIQNVDDCDYKDISNCNLDIQFQYDSDPGQIILTYNENGFTPFNVFAITGIAEASKNISPDKIEIGEKGIGFKSVFGIAKTVLIQSGMFSFRLSQDSFIVPIPCYEDFKPVKGTRLTLDVDPNTCKQIYRELVKQYSKNDALLNRNPILFLNKLTHLKIYQDENWRYMEFHVERKKAEDIGNGICLEENVAVSVDTMNHIDVADNNVPHKEIRCFRYNMPITYGRKECEARYGEDAAFSERHHNLIAIFPNKECLDTSFNGIMYSFLPTQIHLQAPLVLHVPFKLDGSREFVDPQGKNAWFSYTVEKLNQFLISIYIDLSRREKEDIVYYLPTKNHYFVKMDNEKVRCLQIPELRADQIYGSQIFRTSDDQYESADNIVSLKVAEGEHFDDLAQVYRLLKLQNKLFLAPQDVDMRDYGGDVKEHLTIQLFRAGLRQEDSLNEILDILDKQVEFKPDYAEIIKDEGKISLSFKQIQAIAAHPNAVEGFRKYSKACLDGQAGSSVPDIRISIMDLEPLPEDFCNEIRESVELAGGLKKRFVQYLQFIQYSFYSLDTPSDNFALLAQNGIILSKTDPRGAFSTITSDFDQNHTYTATLQMRSASEKLNHADASMSNDEYMTLLRDVRRSLRDAFGKEAYGQYVRLINESGTDKNRFLDELIQNADDCEYPKGAMPTFTLSNENGDLVASYNETGFTKSNVRAITAIGESTKKKLLNNQKLEIGEKGIGFKSVFGVADSVDIHSNGFDFRLTAEKPTIPAKCLTIQNLKGTRMVFHMKNGDDVRRNITTDRLLTLCLCLRNLKRIDVFGHQVMITDDGNTRTIGVDEESYSFKKFVHAFEILDEAALQERGSKGREIGPDQNVVCYLPDRVKSWKEYNVYSGLPLKITSRVPIIIDAPFELTTSRENIQDNRWNTLIRNEVYEALLRIIEKEADKGLDVLRYVGFHAQNGRISWGNFDDGFLNKYNWISGLQKTPFLKRMDTGELICPGSSCRIIPDFIAEAVSSNGEDITRVISSGVVVDTRGKSQYHSLLTTLGCKKITSEEMGRCLEELVPKYIRNNEKFRESLYDYLVGNRGNDTFDRIQNVKELAIIPVKYARDRTEFISFCENIYKSTEVVSNGEDLILNEALMSAETFDAIFHTRIETMSDEVLQTRYQKRFLARMKDPTVDDQTKGQFVVDEWHSQQAMWKACQDVFQSNANLIPLRRGDKKYHSGSCFRNPDHYEFEGTFLPKYIVDDKFDDLAAFLGCRDIRDIRGDDIEDEDQILEDEDIDDLLMIEGLTNYYDIFQNLYNLGLISDEQVEENDLLVSHNDDDETYKDEDFPEDPIRDRSHLQRIRNTIRNNWQGNKNPYRTKKIIRWVPSMPVKSTDYLLQQYKSNDSGYCFCQMCGQKKRRQFTEKRSIEKEPAYAWPQMNLCLCLECSKEYVRYRNNKYAWQEFEQSIMDADVTQGGTVDIPIGPEQDNKSITFTAVHLAEVQEIMRQEGYGDSAPKRNTSKITSSEDVEDGEDTEW